MSPELLQLLEDVRHELTTLHGLFLESEDRHIDVRALLGRLDGAIAQAKPEQELNAWITSSVQGAECPFPD